MKTLFSWPESGSVRLSLSRGDGWGGRTGKDQDFTVLPVLYAWVDCPTVKKTVFLSVRRGVGQHLFLTKRATVGENHEERVVGRGGPGARARLFAEPERGL